MTSWTTFSEVLTKPLQARDAVAEAGYRGFFVPSAHFEIIPVDQSIAGQAAILRAQYGFRLPDAIHIATGLVAKCSHFLTGDDKWSKTGQQVVLAADL